MSNNTANTLPTYITSATPNPASNRAPWYKNTAPTYAGIFLWFVFWSSASGSDNIAQSTLAQGVGWALISLLISALVCHFLFYLVPGLFGQKTGLPLYIVGTSTFGASGGFIMPGFLMGVLQFGWLGVNVYFSSCAIGGFFDAKINPGDFSTIPIWVKIIMVVWGVLAAFVGLKGIQYVAKVATYLPLIPLAILILMLVKTLGSVGDFKPEVLTAPAAAAEALTGKAAMLDSFGVLALMLTVVVGFFATAGAAGVDFGTNSRDAKDVQWGGLVGIALAILFTAGAALLIVAGVYGNAALMKSAVEQKAGLNAFNMIGVIFSQDTARWFKLGLAIAAFPPACFSSFIAANSFKTTLPKVNPFVSVGIGAAVSILLSVFGIAGKAVQVFQIIGASFGPICGAMLVDYLINGKRWTGPRAGFNPAGWIAWALGFVVGILPFLKVNVPAAPVAAFIVGAVVYFVCAKAGMQSQVVPLPAAEKQAA